MQEKLVTLTGVDGNTIYGKITTNNNKKLIVHIHGLTMSMQSLLEVMGGSFFPQNGYDHYRVGLYTMGVGSRTLTNSTISTHLADINTVLEHFAEQYDEIYYVGHSFGGLCAVLGNFPQVKAYSLWDPSLDVPLFWEKTEALRPNGDGNWVVQYGCEPLISNEMLEEINIYTGDVCLEHAAKIEKPVQMMIPQSWSIFSTNKENATPEHFADAFAGETDVTYIENAQHRFAELGTQEPLFTKTLAWFNRF